MLSPQCQATSTTHLDHLFAKQGAQEVILCHGYSNLPALSVKLTGLRIQQKMAMRTSQILNAQ